MIEWRPHELAPQTWLIGYRDGEEVGSIIEDHVHADGQLLVRRADGNVVGHCDTWAEAKARLEGRRPEKRSQKAPTSTSFRWSSLRDTHGARELSCDHCGHGFVGMVREREGGDWEAFDYANRSLGIRHGKRRAAALVTRHALKVVLPEWERDQEEEAMQKIDWTKTMTGWTGKLAGETVGWVVEHETHFEAQTAAGGGAVLGQHGNAMRAKAAVEAAFTQETDNVQDQHGKQSEGSNHGVHGHRRRSKHLRQRMHSVPRGAEDGEGREVPGGPVDRRAATSGHGRGDQAEDARRRRAEPDATQSNSAEAMNDHEQEATEMASRSKKKNNNNTDQPKEAPEEVIDGSASAEDDSSLETRPTTRTLRCELSRDDLLAKADRAAHIVAEHDRRQAELDNAKKQAKAEIDRLEAEYRSLSVQIRDRAEYRKVDCDETRNYRTWSIVVTRKDTGESVDERAMTLDERRAAQTELPLDNDGDDDPETQDDVDDATLHEAATADGAESPSEPQPEPAKPRRGRKRAAEARA